MKVDSKLLLGLLVGAAIGGAVAYLATTDKKEAWMDEINALAAKAKEGLNEAIEMAKNKYLKDTETTAETTAEAPDTVPAEV